jgi:hypothetical protein
VAYNRRGILRAPSLWDHLDQVRFAIAAMKFDMVAVLGKYPFLVDYFDNDGPYGETHRLFDPTKHT